MKITFSKKSDVRLWAEDMFKTMRGANNLKLSVDDMKSVRELAVRRFGYMMFVFNDVAEAFKDINN